MQVEPKQGSVFLSDGVGPEILVDFSDEGSTRILRLNYQNNITGRDTNSADPAGYKLNN